MRNALEAQDKQTHGQDCKDFGEWLEKHCMCEHCGDYAGDELIDTLKQGRMPNE